MIRVRDLKKSYGDFEAVRGISFDMPRGLVLGFLGPNGAGKTTTMKILTCFMAPSSGSASIGDQDVQENTIAVRRQIGYLPEDTPIYPDMTVLEYLDFVGRLRELDDQKRHRRIGELADICGLDRMLGKPVGQLSKGLRQRAGLAQAMLHDPPVLVLDEPTSGLDPNQIAEIRKLVKEIGREKTVILSTHILPEVQATCGRVIIIHDGKMVADGTPEELSSQQHENSYRLLIDPGESGSDAVFEALRGIAGVDKVAESEGEPDALGLLVTASGDDDLRREIFSCVRDKGWLLLEMQRQQLSLEDVFRKLTR